MSVEWKPVVGWEGLYEVSSIGGVRSLDRVVPHGRHGSVLRQGQELRRCRTHATPYVTLCALGMSHTVRVGVLVCEAFVGPRPPKYRLGLRDGKRTAVWASNVYWRPPIGKRLTPGQAAKVRRLSHDCTASLLAEVFGVTIEEIDRALGK